jgi:hypothetical protein
LGAIPVAVPRNIGTARAFLDFLWLDLLGRDIALGLGFAGAPALAFDGAAFDGTLPRGARCGRGALGTAALNRRWLACGSSGGWP